MKLVSLNIRHGGGIRVPGILRYLLSHDPDVIVLTEFRENANAEPLRSGLAAGGLRHFAAASIDPKQNSVCILSKVPFETRTYPDLPPQDRHRLISAHFNDIAVYGVYFSQNKAKAGLFEFLAKNEHRPTETTYFIVGDFNTGIHFQDEQGATFYCAAQFQALSESGLIDSWRTRNPNTKEFSWFSNHGNGFRIDHVFSNPAADSSIQQVFYDHLPRESKVTDHSALVVEVS